MEWAHAKIMCVVVERVFVCVCVGGGVHTVI